MWVRARMLAQHTTIILGAFWDIQGVRVFKISPTRYEITDDTIIVVHLGATFDLKCFATLNRESYRDRKFCTNKVSHIV